MNYREAYGIHASNGILFNHESPIRGETFVTRKITRAVAAIEAGLQEQLVHRQSQCPARLGPRPRLRRGHVDDLAAAAARRLCAGDRRQPHRARIRRARLCGDRPPIAGGAKESDETGIDEASGKVLIKIDPRYFRPTEVDVLVGDASKAHAKLGWRHRVDFDALVGEMVEEDRKALRGEIKRKQAGMTELMAPPVLFDLRGKRVYVAGHTGLAGSAIVRRLASRRLRNPHGAA